MAPDPDRADFEADLFQLNPLFEDFLIILICKKGETPGADIEYLEKTVGNPDETVGILRDSQAEIVASLDFIHIRWNFDDQVVSVETNALLIDREKETASPIRKIDIQAAKKGFRIDITRNFDAQGGNIHQNIDNTGIEPYLLTGGPDLRVGVRLHQFA